MFQNLSFSVDRRTALTVTGANGIGKSSLLRTLAGLVPLAHGSIRLEDSEDDKPVHEHAHYFGHQDAVKPALTVLENLEFWRAFSAPVQTDWFSGAARSPLAALDTLGIGHTAQLPAAYLSAGQKRRLSLARLLVTPRPIWLMDEPTSALDKASEHNLLNLMNAHLEDGGLIIVATHTELALDNCKELHLEATESVTPDKSAEAIL